MKTPLLAVAVAAAILVPAGATLAQNTIPNGLAGGTETFTTAPTQPVLSSPGNLPVPAGSNIGSSGISGHSPAPAPRRLRSQSR